MPTLHKLVLINGPNQKDILYNEVENNNNDKNSLRIVRTK